MDSIILGNGKLFESFEKAALKNDLKDPEGHQKRKLKKKKGDPMVADSLLTTRKES